MTVPPPGKRLNLQTVLAKGEATGTTVRFTPDRTIFDRNAHLSATTVLGVRKAPEEGRPVDERPPPGPRLGRERRRPPTATGDRRSVRHELPGATPRRGHLCPAKPWQRFARA